MTLTLVAVGLAAGEDAGDLRQILMLVLAAVLFHVGVFVCNDVVDIRIDRTDSRRQDLPLSSGLVPPWGGVAVVGIVLPMGAAVLWWSNHRSAVLVCYGFAVTGLLIYDLLGKKTRVPPLLDLIQGAGWSGLFLVAVTSAGHITSSARWLACSAGLYVALVNGVIASLRDLPNDYRHRAGTTAVMFMGRCGALADSIPASYVRYALVLHVTLATTCVVGVATLDRQIDGSIVQAITVSALGEVVCLVLLVVGLLRYDTGQAGWIAGLSYVLIALWAFSAPILATFGWLAFTATSLVLSLPWFGSRVVQSVFRMGR